MLGERGQMSSEMQILPLTNVWLATKLLTMSMININDDNNLRNVYVINIPNLLSSY